MKNPKKQVALFEEKEIRRTWHREQWYFVINDIVAILTKTPNVSDYIKKLKQRDPEIAKGWGQIVTPLSIDTRGGVQKLNCANLRGIFRIIQSIHSPKAEPFKQWLAKVGQERIEEIQDPEKTITRAKGIYEKKGYSEEWISKRMRGINVRNNLTDQWKNRGARGRYDFAILTNEIYQGTFKMDAKEIKKFKSLNSPDNPRNHMNELELILTMLGEATTTEITEVRNSKGLPKLSQDAKEGGQIAGNTRKEIEQKTSKEIMTSKNFLATSKNKLSNLPFLKP